MEGHTECEFDSLFIKNGATEDDEEAKIGTFCGENSPGQFTSIENELFVKFKSDRTGQKKGFRATYKSNYERCLVTFRFIIYYVSLDIVVCGGPINASSLSWEDKVYISSPNFPEFYPKRTKCVWVIEALKGNNVALEFDTFEVTSSSVVLSLRLPYPYCVY